MTFYIVDEPAADDTGMEAWMTAGFNTGDARRCPSCGGTMSMLEWLPPYEVVVRLYGTTFSDMLFLPGGELLLSQRFVDIWRQNGLVGLSGIEPARIVKIKSRRKKRPEPPEYFRARVDLTSVQIDVIASGIEWIDPPTCEHCRGGMLVRWKRVVVERETWGGQDLFVAKPMYGVVIASLRFKQLWDDHQFTGVQIVPAEQYECDFYPGLTQADLRSHSEVDSVPSPENNGTKSQ